MTRAEIREMMIRMVNDTITAELEEMNIEDRITEQDIQDFMWTHDFGMDLVEQYINENEDEIKETFLETIFEEIDTDDLGMPW